MLAKKNPPAQNVHTINFQRDFVFTWKILKSSIESIRSKIWEDSIAFVQTNSFSALSHITVGLHVFFPETMVESIYRSCIETDDNPLF